MSLTVLLAGICFVACGKVDNVSGAQMSGVEIDSTLEGKSVGDESYSNSEAPDESKRNATESMEPSIVAAQVSGSDLMTFGEVRIKIGNTGGAGTIWGIEDDKLIIVSARHVLSSAAAVYMEQAKAAGNASVAEKSTAGAPSEESGDSAEQALSSVGKVTFYDGEAADIAWVFSSPDEDVGIVIVPTEEVSEDCLARLKGVLAARSAVTIAEADIPVSCVYIDPDTAVTEIYSGVVAEPDIYIENLEQNMMYVRCYAREGMSGGGLYDENYAYAGLIVGGTEENELLCIPYERVEGAVSALLADRN